MVLGTNNVDFRSRPSSAEEAEFLAATAITDGLGVTYEDLEAAKQYYDELMAVLDRVGLGDWARERGGLDARVGDDRQIAFLIGDQ